MPVFENGVFVGLFGGVYAYEGVVRSLTSPQLLQANDVDLVDASGKILLELPNTGTVDQELIYEVLLTPAENEVRLRLSGHRQIPFEWGLLSLEAVCFALVLGMAYAMLALKRENEQRRRAENEVLNEREHLEEMVAARTADLAAANANLDAANKELETFAYSVSHDLRAPLRAIGGFSCMIIDDYGPKLDSEGRRLLNVVRDSALKMSWMIEDILSFSRVGRAELTAASIDMKALVQAAIADLAPATTGRNVSFAVGELPPARGDASMFQRVWTNLLDNAVKYTTMKPEARIEVGGTAGPGETVYFVRDNGAGFDMQYVDKLFGVFQRLHGAEFPGTGIGLAIVKRIVTRHGGRVWAEGRPDEGATFWVALPNESVGRD